MDRCGASGAGTLEYPALPAPPPGRVALKRGLPRNAASLAPGPG